MLSKLLLTLMIAYPVVAFVILWFKQPLFLIIYLLSIFLLLSIQKCINKKWASAAILFTIVGLISYFIQQENIEYFIYMPPMLMLFGLFILFSQSLFGDQIPLITRYAMMLNDKDKIDERHYNYSRLLTILWSIFFLLMAIISLSLAIFSSLDTWSLFTNVISYILIAAFFVIEFYVRKRLFSNLDSLEGGFFQFIRKISKISPFSINNASKKQ